VTLIPLDAEIPRGIATDEFVVRQLRASDCSLDLDAMRERENFRELVWDENLRDLEMHEREHDERVAFTYTVMNRDETRCLGCVYVRPRADAAGGAVILWVRPALVESGLEQRLFDALRPWFGGWPIPIAYRTDRREPDAAKARQRAMFAAAGLGVIEDARDGEFYS
jgi:hypothetical protein